MNKYKLAQAIHILGIVMIVLSALPAVIVAVITGVPFLLLSNLIHSCDFEQVDKISDHRVCKCGRMEY